MLCVNPPLAGTPLPDAPVNVRVYVPLVMPLLVWIMAVLLTLFDPVRDTELGETLQVEPDGAPLQDSATVPVKPFSGVSVSL